MQPAMLGPSPAHQQTGIGILGSSLAHQWAFSQRKHTDDQQIHEKLLNITNHQGNACQNHEISPHIFQNDYQQKRQQITSAAEDVEKKGPSCSTGGIVNRGSCYRKKYGVFSKN